MRLDVTADREGDELCEVTLVEQENERIARIGIALATHLSQALNAMMKEEKRSIWPTRVRGSMPSM